MHDILEGVVAEDLLSVIKVLIAENYFTEASYNIALQRHEYKSFETSDLPELIDLKKQKLRGKAMSICCHLRNFGMIVRHLT